jgi:CRP/FNR family cyclic AMP-dependent transcriptional regulator
VALEAGQVLFAEGDPPDSMYVVNSGTLRIRSGGVIYEDVGPGGIVGEMALVEHYPARSATVYALTDSELVAVDEAHFTPLVANLILPSKSCGFCRADCAGWIGDIALSR